MTTEPDQKGEEVKQNAVTNRKDEEEVAEMKKLEDMVMMNMQTLQPTTCTMLPIIYVK